MVRIKTESDIARDRIAKGLRRIHAALTNCVLTKDAIELGEKVLDGYREVLEGFIVIETEATKDKPGGFNVEQN